MWCGVQFERPLLASAGVAATNITSASSNGPVSIVPTNNVIEVGSTAGFLTMQRPSRSDGVDGNEFLIAGQSTNGALGGRVCVKRC